MDVKEAKFQLEMARYKLNGCEGHLDRAHRELHKGELASRGNNKLHYAFKELVETIT